MFEYFIQTMNYEKLLMLSAEEILNVSLSELDTCTEEGFTYLENAIIDGNIPLALSLIEAGVNTSCGFDALCMAIVENYPPIIDAILKAIVLQSQLDAALTTCIHTGNLKYLKIIVSRGGNINYQDSKGFTPMMNAISIECDDSSQDLHSKMIKLISELGGIIQH